MTWNIGHPPKNTLVALVVRRWVGQNQDGLRVSFLARDPGPAIAALGGKFAEIDFEPDQTICMGRLVETDGDLEVLNEDGDMAGFLADAILAWSAVPSFASDQAAATLTNRLMREFAHARR